MLRLIMPHRNLILANDNFYHIYNRGVGSIPIFKHKRDYKNFLDLLNYYRYKEPSISYSTYKKLNLELREAYWKKLISQDILVDILVFSLMPNHYHLTLKQNMDNGIRDFISNVQNSHSKTFNLKHQRKGPLYESRFYSKYIETDEQLLHLSRYQHLNPVTGYLVEIEQLEDFEWSSHGCYLNTKDLEYINTSLILELAGGVENYRKFVEDQVDYQRELDKIKHLIIE